jgi:hypothetical protein
MSEDEPPLFWARVPSSVLQKKCKHQNERTQATGKTMMTRGMYSGGLATVILNVSESLIAVPRALVMLSLAFSKQLYMLHLRDVFVACLD